MSDLTASWIDRLITRPWLCGLLLATLSFGIPAALDLGTGLPVPRGQDEASYLLAADTFASGRVANPTHPMWQHFETFHVIQRPTYVSKFPPLQGLFLAAGQVLTGHPAVGIWLGTAFMTAAIFWMFMAWLPSRWALFGGLMAVGQLGILGYWAHSYWGGAVAAGGGALVLGSVRRMVDEPTARHGLILGLGLGVLANTRPMEGLILALLASLPLARCLWKEGRSFRRAFLWRSVPPLVVVLGFTATAMAYYFWRTTGSPVRMPYQVYQEAYSYRSLMPWVAPRPAPEYRHEVMRDLYMRWGERPSPLGQPVTFTLVAAAKFAWLYVFFLGVLGFLPMLAIRRAWRGLWVRYAVVTVLVLLVFTLSTRAYPHYMAPVAGLVLFIGVEAARRLPEVRWRSIDGRRLLDLTVILFMVGIAARVELHVNPIFPNGFVRQREDVRQRLEALPGDHLVIVRYEPGHLFHNEWVFNRADIDEARIVWARDMGGRENADLLEYFPRRTTWLLEAGKPEGVILGHKEEIVTLEPYDASKVVEHR